MQCYKSIESKEERREEVEEEKPKQTILAQENSSTQKVSADALPIKQPPELVNLPPLITLSDKIEYGKVNRYLKDHPKCKR